MEGNGNPTPEAKPAAITSEEENFRFPPCNQHPIVTQNKLTGDVWLGVSPIRMSRGAAIAWAAFQLENLYDQIEVQIKQNQSIHKDKPNFIQRILRPH